jgi:hypothetical protein
MFQIRKKKCGCFHFSKSRSEGVSTFFRLFGTPGGVEKWKHPQKTSREPLGMRGFAFLHIYTARIFSGGTALVFCEGDFVGG